MYVLYRKWCVYLLLPENYPGAFGVLFGDVLIFFFWFKIRGRRMIEDRNNGNNLQCDGVGMIM